MDISRFVSRAHLPFDTGIDRVERAFILDTLKRFENAHFIARAGKDFMILDADGMQNFLDLELHQNWPYSHGRDIFRLKLPRAQRRIRSAMRKFAQAQCRIENLPTALNKLSFYEFDYTNVGHSNLSAKFLEAMRHAGALKISVFVHDIIPLDYPQYCRADRVKSFAQKMENVMGYCNQVYCNSQYTADRISAYFEKTPKMQIVHLASHQTAQREKIALRKFSRPTFAMLGTIEPRKNLRLILDAWEILAERLPTEKVPNLIIVGRRGWEETDTLDRLDRAKNVQELNDLSDEDVQNYLASCAGLLFPSHVEGYGLPAQEAIALGVPVIASDIPVFRELFTNDATLLPIHQPQDWADFIENALLRPEILNQAKNLRTKTKTWDDFFSEIYTNAGIELLS